MIQSVNLHNESLLKNVVTSNGTASITVYPRVHMFSLDLSNKLNLRAGSMGFSMKTSPITISVCSSSDTTDHIVSDVAIKELQTALELFRAKYKLTKHWQIRVVTKNLVPHSGLGSTTQTVGGVILAIAALEGVNLTFGRLAEFGIGQVSGLGIALLCSPGLILEFGYQYASSDGEGRFPHPLLPNLYDQLSGAVISITPENPMYAIVASPTTRQSLSGTEEDGFWADHLPTAPEASEKICYEVLMRLMPSIINSSDLNSDLYGSLAAIVKLGTKPAEEKIQSESTKRLLTSMRDKFSFAGLSSLGPTIYALSQAEPNQKDLELLGEKFSDYKFTVTAL